MKALDGFKSIFGEITAEELEAIEARRVARERKIAEFQHRPTQESDTDNNILRA